MKMVPIRTIQSEGIAGHTGIRSQLTIRRMRIRRMEDWARVSLLTVH